MIYCEFCEMSKNIIFYRTPPVAASANNQLDTLLNSYFEEHLFLRGTFLNGCFCSFIKFQRLKHSHKKRNSLETAYLLLFQSCSCLDQCPVFPLGDKIKREVSINKLKQSFERNITQSSLDYVSKFQIRDLSI